MKPVFKPKFSVPSSQNCGNKIVTSNGTSNALSAESSKTNVANSENISEDQIVDSASESDEGSNKDQESKSQECNSRSGNNVEVQRTLTEEQYEDIFLSVLARAADGTLPEPKRSGPRINPNDAAKQFKTRTENISPTNVQDQNEITPNTSPQDEIHSPPKLLLKKQVKKKPENKGNHIPNKRKTLEYNSNQRNSLDSNVGACKKVKHKQAKHKRSKTDSEVVKNRKKVLSKGIWVQCCQKDCLKWRYLPDCSDPSTLPNYWMCSMNKDDNDQSSCLAPEIDWTSCLTDSQDHFVYTEYNAGSIVWAKMDGYPAWPAMVDSDPDIDMFYEYDHMGRVLRYHVVFLDDKVSRAWIPARAIEPYERNIANKMVRGREFRAELETAISAADEAMNLSLEKRIKKYSFEKRFCSSDAHKEWTSKKQSKKHSKSKNRKDLKKNCDSQVVPSSKDNESALPTKTKESDSEDYWEYASDSVDKSSDSEPDLPDIKVNKKSSSKTAKQGSAHKNKCKEAKKPTVYKQLSKVVEKAKAPIKPSFTAPCKKKVSKKTNPDSTNAVVPTSPVVTVPDRDDSEVNDCSKPAECERKITYDPDIYTMEIDESDAFSKDHKLLDEAKATEKQVDDRADDSEPLDLSLKYNTADEDVGLISPVLNNKSLLDEDFWEVATDKIDPGGSQDPFGDLVEEKDPEKLQDWDDERMQQLDELMPVISGNF